MPRFLIILLILTSKGIAQNSFPPPDEPIRIKAYRAAEKIILDGKLTESIWKSIPPIRGFKQVEPRQGDPADFDTDVKIVFDENKVFIGFFCHDTTGIKGLNVPNLQRDFDIDNNDVFGLALDPLNTKRNAVAFQVTPYGNMRDLQVFDDSIFDLDWDALWESKTIITEKGWGGEIAIPFSSFRYSAKISESTFWGINFIRIQRRLNQVSAFPGFPRSLDTYRMTYTALLTGVETPTPAPTIRINPYTLILGNHTNDLTAKTKDFKIKLGGEVKWAPSQHSLVDLTVNTDFAQADVDQQIVNLTRFSVQFPEKRSFFLENAGMFITGDGQNIEPFFTRKIGLDANGNAIPILAGVKYTDRTLKRSIGALYVLQEGVWNCAPAHFSVGRYIKNYGNSSSVGFLLTNKFMSDSINNTVVALNGLHRIDEKWSVKYLYSNSLNHTSQVYAGTSSFISAQYNSNKLYFTTNQTLISKDYSPAIGFISRGNLLTHNSGLVAVLRPSWLPRYARSFQPGVFLSSSQRASDFQMQETSVSFFPFYLYFSNGALLTFRYQLNWQYLASDFELLNTYVPIGNYAYQRSRLKYNTDLSRKISFSASGETGGYFDGKLTTMSGELRIAPIPHLFISAAYELNKFKGFGELKSNLSTQLLTTSARLAINPNVQLISFLQFNSSNENTRINIRFSWQYKPLSFIYFVVNLNDNGVTNVRETNSIVKMNLLKQF